MQLVTKKLSEIKPYKNNPRKNDMAVDDVAESIRQCDYNAPIVVDENNVILAGHTRLAALKQLGYDEAEVIVKEGLTEKQKKKYRLLDNKTGEKSEWDYDKLMQELDGMDFEGFDFGFDSFDFESNADEAYEENEQAPSEFKEYGEDIPTTNKCPKCGYEW